MGTVAPTRTGGFLMGELFPASEAAVSCHCKSSRAKKPRDIRLGKVPATTVHGIFSWETFPIPPHGRYTLGKPRRNQKPPFPADSRIPKGRKTSSGAQEVVITCPPKNKNLYLCNRLNIRGPMGRRSFVAKLRLFRAIQILP